MEFITMKQKITAFSGLLFFCVFFLTGSSIQANYSGKKPVKNMKEMSVEKESFGKTADGKAIDIYTFQNKNGMKAKITNFGATVTELWVPDKNGKSIDVVLGYKDLAGYENDNCYFGVTVGRYANRIGKAKFSLNGTEYKLKPNDGPNMLHGGKIGFNKAIWQVEPQSKKGTSTITLSYLSKDGENDFPGNLKVKVTFTLTNSNELKIDYLATTDKTTVINLTNHSYFNLAGPGTGDILDHVVMINANTFTPVDSTLITTGEMRKVAGTPFDFLKPTRIGERIDNNYDQLKLGRGYDHNWVLNKNGKRLSLAAKVIEPKSGRIMEVLTTEPGVQLYTGNFLDGSVTGKDAKVYKHRYGFCLETQHYPDSPNKPEFPTVKLEKGQKYKTTTIYKFSTEK